MPIAHYSAYRTPRRVMGRRASPRPVGSEQPDALRWSDARGALGPLRRALARKPPASPTCCACRRATGRGAGLGRIAGLLPRRNGRRRRPRGAAAGQCGSRWQPTNSGRLGGPCGAQPDGGPCCGARQPDDDPGSHPLGDPDAASASCDRDADEHSTSVQPDAAPCHADGAAAQPDGFVAELNRRVANGAPGSHLHANPALANPRHADAGGGRSGGRG
jgi:hypothetical protein